MNPLIEKIAIGAFLCLGVGGPSTYLAVDRLIPKTVQQQLNREKLKIIDEKGDTKWKDKVKDGQNSDLKEFGKKHKNNSGDTVDENTLKEVCQSLLEKRTSEVDYEAFKKHCSEKKK